MENIDNIVFYHEINMPEYIYTQNLICKPFKFIFFISKTDKIKLIKQIFDYQNNSYEESVLFEIYISNIIKNNYELFTKIILMIGLNINSNNYICEYEENMFYICNSFNNIVDSCDFNFLNKVILSNVKKTESMYKNIFLLKEDIKKKNIIINKITGSINDINDMAIMTDKNYFNKLAASSKNKNIEDTPSKLKNLIEENDDIFRKLKISIFEKEEILNNLTITVSEKEDILTKINGMIDEKNLLIDESSDKLNKLNILIDNKNNVLDILNETVNLSNDKFNHEVVIDLESKLITAKNRMNILNNKYNFQKQETEKLSFIIKNNNLILENLTNKNIYLNQNIKNENNKFNKLNTIFLELEMKANIDNIIINILITLVIILISKILYIYFV